MHKLAPSTRSVVAAAALLSFVSGCGESPQAPTVAEARSQLARLSPSVSADESAALAIGNAAFALRLFKQTEKADKNFVFSPISISVALAMTFAGARGDTEAEMAQALSFMLPQERLHPAMNLLGQELSQRGGNAKGADGGPFRLHFVNTLWAQDNLTLHPGFLDVQAQHYGAGVNLLDFAGAPEACRKTINGWVSSKTQERIDNLLAPGVINARTRLVLTNAIYMNAAWKNPFSKNTVDADFTRLDGTSTSVKMMSQSGSLRSFDSESLQAVELPYEDEQLSMLIIIPKAGKYPEVESLLTTDALATIASGLQAQDVNLHLPRFKFESPLLLEESLAQLGMRSAFSDEADFSAISPSKLRITNVVHKSLVAVGEKGTEAAAATAVVLGRKSSPQGIFMAASRPFMFLLRDRPTGAILFLGRVMDPSF